MFQSSQRCPFLLLLSCSLCWRQASDVFVAATPTALHEDVCEGTACMRDDSYLGMKQFEHRRQFGKGDDAGGAAFLQVSHVQALVNRVTSDIASARNAPMTKYFFNARRNASHSSSSKLSMVEHWQPANSSAASPMMHAQRIRCGELLYSPDGACPKACPYFAEEGGKNKTCYFRCLRANQCGTLPLQSSHSIADPKLLICRRCQVMGCAKCLVGKGDTCETCEKGMILFHGQCYGKASLWVQLLLFIGAMLVLLITVWVVRLSWNEVTNPRGLEEGLAFRSGLKLRVPKAAINTEAKPLSELSDAQVQKELTHMYHRNQQDFYKLAESLSAKMSVEEALSARSSPRITSPRIDSARTPREPAPPEEAERAPERAPERTQECESSAGSDAADTSESNEIAETADTDEENEDTPLWPIPQTNLHFAQVAGPGLTLYMNFQLAIILLGLVVVSTWVIFAYFTNPDMLVLGLSVTDTPAKQCSVILRGYRIQQRVMTSKVSFMLLMLLLFIVFNFTYSLYQRRRFLAIEDDASMGDFAAICSGLPEFSGEQRAEEVLKDFIQEQTGIKVVGVSLCWDFKKVSSQVDEANEDEVRRLDYVPPDIPNQEELDAKKSFLQKNLFGYVDMLFGFTGKVPEPKKPEDETDVEEMLKSLKSTSTAFVVFESEDARDKAVQAVKALSATRAATLKGSKINLSDDITEPDTVQWGNFNVGHAQFSMNCIIGVLVIIGALACWATCCYLPSAVTRAEYARRGEEPPMAHQVILVVLVLGGNQMMYTLSRIIATRVGFQSNDKLEAFYISLYTFSCFANVLVDLIMEYAVTLVAFQANSVETADGKLLEDLTSHQEIFESYLMQKELGMRLMTYCFPATFLLPFILEPIAAIALPFQISKWLLRTHPEVRGHEAEKSMDFFSPMDLGRYGDITLNLLLSSIVVFFPPGTFLKMFLCLVISHVYIYFLDYYRIMRCVPKFDVASDYIDRMVQMLLAAPTAILAAGVVFKSSSIPGSKLKGYGLAFSMFAASSACMLLQILIVKVIVPALDEELHVHHKTDTSYAQVAARQSSNWFSENPVFCLRSKYIYKHKPPCLYNARGKNYLIRPNPSIGLHFFEDHRVDAHEYENWKHVASNGARRLSHVLEKFHVHAAEIIEEAGESSEKLRAFGHRLSRRSG